MRAVCKYMCSAYCTVCCVQKYCDAMAVRLQTRYVVTEGVLQHWDVLRPFLIKKVTQSNILKSNIFATKCYFWLFFRFLLGPVTSENAYDERKCYLLCALSFLLLFCVLLFCLFAVQISSHMKELTACFENTDILCVQTNLGVFVFQSYMQKWLRKSNSSKSSHRSQTNQHYSEHQSLNHLRTSFIV